MTGIANDATTSAISDTYTYNGLDQRVAKGGSGGGQVFTRADDAIDSPVLQDWMASYNYGAGNELVSEVHALPPTPQSRFYKSDDLGTTRAVRDDTGTLRDVLDCDAFGNALSSTMGNTQPPFGFAGKAGYQTDLDTGLMLLGHRFYDSNTGRFLSRDPVQDGYNWYTYCDNDPVNETDAIGYTNSGHGGGNKTPVKLSPTVTKDPEGKPISVGPSLGNPSGNAMTIGGVTHINIEDLTAYLSDKQWREHEHQHLEQEKNMGTVVFFITIVAEYIINGGHDGAPLEIDADNHGYGKNEDPLPYPYGWLPVP